MMIFRLPLMQDKNSKVNLFFPRSHCVACKKTISAANLMPVIGFLFQKGKCNFCKAQISPMYPLNELVHLLVGIFLYFIFGLSIQLFFAYFVFFNFFILFVLDLKYFLLPFLLNLGMVLIGFIAIGVCEIFTVSTLGFDQFYISLLGLLSGFSVLWLINAFYKLIKGIDGIGGGDFILLSSIGSMVGILALPFVILLGSLSALLIYLFNEKSAGKEIPLGSGFILGFLLYCFMNYFELLQSYMVY